MTGEFRQVIDTELRQLVPGVPNYPSVLKRCSDHSDPPTIISKGHLGVLNNNLVGFFCSVRSPGDVILKTYDLARTIRKADVTIVGGFQSPMEKECLDLLLRGTASVVVCPARGIGRMRIPGDWKKPLAEGRLLLLSFFDDGVRRATADLAARRNAYVAALVDRVLVAHAGKGSKTEKLCRDALAGGKPVFTLDSPDNAHLVDDGAVPLSASSLTALTSWC